ncbi:MAG: hypothetical protein ACM3ZB_04835 [bacterium]|jgi:hypothetical protein
MPANVRLCIAVAVVVAAQNVALAAEPSTDLDRAKAMALQVCMALQEQAQRSEQEGRPARFLPRAFAASAGLNDSEAGVMVSVAARMRSQVQPLDDRAQAIIQAVRAKYPGGRLQPGTVPPPLPAELAELQRQRNAIVEQAVRELDRELGPAGRAKLNSHLEERMRQKAFKRLPVQSPDQIGPSGSPVEPEPMRREKVQ